MPIRNLHWYNRNEGEPYPLDDAATAVTADGNRVPSNIVTDLNLRWPSHLGRYAFVASLSVTDALVTLTIQAAQDLDDADFAPLAVVSVPKPVQQGRMYALLPQAEGVGGWVVFGGGVEDQVPYRGRFRTPRDGLLCPRAARPYRPLPVKSLGVLNQDVALTGIVRLSAQDPLVVAKEEREIDGVLRDCLVVRLTDGAGTDGFPVPAAAQALIGSKEQTVFQKFAGPCAGRPESGTCGDPQPIEYVNAVPPDCDGVLTLEFAGCAVLAKLLEECGIVIDCELGLVDACIPPQIPSKEGLLPGEYDPANIPPYNPPPTPPPSGGDSESLVVIGELPFIDCFSQGSGNFTVEAGLWRINTADDAPEIACREDQYTTSESVFYPVSESLSGSLSVSESFSVVYVDHVRIGCFETATAATRNVALWEGFDVQTVYRRVTTELKLLRGPAGAKQNGGLVVNYRPHQSIAGQHVYYAAEVDYDAQQFRISRWNGSNFLPVAPVTIPGIQLDKWYKIEVTVVPGPSGGSTNITARLRSVTDPGVTDVTVSVTVNNYQPSTGWFGLGSNRALARFAYMRVEEFNG